MAAIGLRRVILGTLAGGVVWGIWSTIVNVVFLMPRYQFAQKAGTLLAHPRYPLFYLDWFVLLFVLSYILTWAYVSVRNVFGPGPITALRVGFLMGFMCAFPLSLSLAAWAPFSRVITLGWMLDLWVGAMLATLVSAWLYKES
jgi:phosphoglycerol transferase MdoB-like AlkP superfamily enzyme